MAKSNTVIPKKRGRPSSGGRDPILTVRLPAEMIEAISSWADKSEVSRSAAVRLLIEAALKSPPPKHNVRMAQLKSEPPGMERDSRGKVIPLKKRTRDDQEKAKRARKRSP